MEKNIYILLQRDANFNTLISNKIVLKEMQQCNDNL